MGNSFGHLDFSYVVSTAGILVQTLLPELHFLFVGVKVKVPDQITLGYSLGGVMSR
jgi:hypothetical protein